MLLSHEGESARRNSVDPTKSEQWWRTALAEVKVHTTMPTGDYRLGRDRGDCTFARLKPLRRNPAWNVVR